VAADADVAAAEERILDRLTPTRREAFEHGQDSVAKQFAKLDAAREKTKAEAKRDEERERDKLARQKKSVAEEREGLKAKADKMQVEVTTELGQIDAKLRIAQAELDRFEAQAVRIYAQQAEIE